MFRATANPCQTVLSVAITSSWPILVIHSEQNWTPQMFLAAQANLENLANKLQTCTHFLRSGEALLEEALTLELCKPQTETGNENTTETLAEDTTFMTLETPQKPLQSSHLDELHFPNLGPGGCCISMTNRWPFLVSKGTKLKQSFKHWMTRIDQAFTMSNAQKGRAKPFSMLSVVWPPTANMRKSHPRKNTFQASLRGQSLPRWQHERRMSYAAAQPTISRIWVICVVSTSGPDLTQGRPLMSL